ncbi:MAG: hypothetical protein U1F76_14895 [Candidatus Competibacteraceae bacterium]
MADNQERPLVTFALFAYNQERFIRMDTQQHYRPKKLRLVQA